MVREATRDRESEQVDDERFQTPRDLGKAKEATDRTKEGES